MATILMDDREDRNTEYRIDFWARGHEVIVQRQTADFAVPELGIGIERKCMNDFLSSLYDGRIFSQVQDLVNDWPIPWLLLDDDPAMYLFDARDSYWAARARIRSMGCHVETTYGRLPTWLHFEILKMTTPSSRYINPIRQAQSKAFSHRDWTMNILLAIPGIGKVKADEVADLNLIPAIRQLMPKIRKEYREYVEGEDDSE